MRLELVSNVAQLIQIASQIPVEAVVRVRTLNQYSEAIVSERLTLMVEISVMATTVQISSSTLIPNNSGINEVSVMIQPASDTTITLRAVGLLAVEIVSMPLEFQVIADTGPAFEPLNLNADTAVSEQDVIIVLRWLQSNRPAQMEEIMTTNLGLTSSSITAGGFSNLQLLFGEQENRSDINDDGIADSLDVRIMLRYLSGLRGDALRETVNMTKLGLILGLEAP